MGEMVTSYKGYWPGPGYADHFTMMPVAGEEITPLIRWLSRKLHQVIEFIRIMTKTFEPVQWVEHLASDYDHFERCAAVQQCIFQPVHLPCAEKSFSGNWAVR